ncbi:uncharacterized protein LOC119610507 [Lucilia sericata]|uniref:uncharacterized protein LOC119610507 n=1 Tax=Lucilia sericata TaxID=13632 RepID=UPI0018A8133D|nr:uncharacterized protein LOC119610507 [Lucilia sericata]XP_037821682.1 uncharacterized protein LOC119610507 [Lucilia sericata]XP_037821683.1 uncharacterized protein LOC119610507 [Lucilia sericata]
MSCQQASRFITNSSNINHNNTHSNRNNHNNSNCKNLNNLSNNSSNNIIKGNRNTRGVIVQQEDPYVFTESVPTTPPILFNTQKTRTRLNDLTSATTLSIGKLQQQQQKLPLTETNGKITTNSLKTQASFLSSSTSTASLITTTNTCTAPTSKTNVIQSLTITATNNNNNSSSNSKKLTNVCIVRPQLQQQQPNYHHHQQQQHQNYANATSLPSSVYEGDLKSISPPPLYTPPTPSLWQTPLLLESPAPQVTNVVVSPKPTITTTTTTSQTTPIMGCVTPTVQTVGSTTTIMNPSLTTTAMAKVAPIIVHTSFAQSHTPPPPPSPAQSPNQQQCLPPSKFHNHTLAQHLHKVECLKKSKKSTDAEVIICNDNVKAITEAASSPFNTPTKAASLKTLDMAGGGVAVKHSETEDLNEIPVNVIFRMAMVPQQNEKSSNNIQFVKPQTDIDLLQPSQTPPPPPPPSSPLSTQLKTNVNKKLSIPASKTIATNQVIKQQQQQQQQINTSSIQNNETTTALNSQQQQTPNNKAATTAAANDDSKITTNSESLTKIINGDTTPTTNLKTKTSTHITNKTRKTNNTLNTTATINLNYDLPYNLQMGCSTTKGAVAIVKMSQHHVDLDTTHLATATGLPYCLQQYWLNSYDLRKSSDLLSMDDKSLNRSLAREERIALYKRQLRRQAMQLISTRSLQKLPIQIARRRLMCVDRLLRKYQHSEQNKKELPANVKRCCVNGCDAYTLEMASHCQQHIVYNSAQHVFLPCTAKFADNTQCRVPVFDITHDLPLCMEHARKRDAYNRLLYEQRPRKISTNPHIMNESKLSANISSNINTVMVGGANVAEAGGVLVKAQTQYQQKQKLQKQQQKQQQHILQQLPANNNSNNGKRPILVNQAARKRKMTVGLTGNPVGRPQKRVKKSIEKSAAVPVIHQQMPRLTATSLKRKSSTTSLESIASNSQHSTTSSTSQQQPQQQYQRQQSQQLQLQNLYGLTSSTTTNSSLPPPALAPLSGLVGHGFPQHLFSFGHDNYHHQNHTQQQHQQQLHPILNLNDKHSFSLTTSNTNTATPATTASTPTELKDFISQFSLAAQKQAQADSSNDVNLLNTNSNSNFTSSGMGSTTSLPTADDFLTQDMLSICENSSASSADTGLGGLSDPELMLGGPEDDIPLGDTHLLEEHDLENVLNSLPEDAFKELFTTVHQDESDEIERAIELADKHLKTLQQTIGSELGDFLDFNDDMLMDNGDLCNGSTANNILDTTALFIGSGGGGVAVGASIGSLASNSTQGGGGAVIGTADIRGLVQT